MNEFNNIESLEEIAQRYLLKQQISEISREESSTNIDLIFTKMKNILESGTLDFQWSDHLPIFLIKKKLKQQCKRISFVGRNYFFYNYFFMKQIIMMKKWDKEKSNDSNLYMGRDAYKHQEFCQCYMPSQIF